MKILNLYFKNINSLEGENRIDFEQPPFSESGVFAITGPNGSGKTSILDAITLALYAETFRFDKPAKHVITQQTNEAFAQIEFALGAEKYRSSWRVKRDPSGADDELLPTEMRLVKITPIEQILGTSVSQVCAKVAEFTGMDFRSFTRSILLAQGDFAAFLNALDNERMDILEKIISTDIYADHKQAITGKLAQAETTLLHLQQDLAAVALITPGALEACKQDLADFNDQASNYRDSIAKLTENRAAYSELERLKQQIAAKEKQLEAFITRQLELQKILEELSAGEAARGFEEAISERQRHQQQVARAESELGKLRNELRQLEATLALPDFTIDSVELERELAERQQAETEIGEQSQTLESLRGQISLVNANWQSEAVLQKTLSDQIAEKQKNLADVDEWLEAHQTEKILVDNYPPLADLKILRTKQQELNEQKRALAKWSKTTQTALQKVKSGIENKTALLAELKQKLFEAETTLQQVSPGRDVEQIQELQKEQQERVKDFQDLLNLAIANAKLVPKPSLFDRLLGRSPAPSRIASEVEQEVDALTAQIKIEENIRLSLERSMFNDALIARMAHDRTYLVDGKPCPLCGATGHPYADHPPVAGNARQALDDQRIKLKRMAVELRELEEQAAYALKRKDRNQANEIKLQQYNGLWQSLCNKLNIATPDMSIDNIPLMKERLGEESLELKNIGNLLGDFKSVQSKIAKLTAQIEKTGKELEKSQQELVQIESEWQNGQGALPEKDSDLLRIQQQEQALASEIGERLAVLGEKPPASGQEDALDGALQKRRADYQSYAGRKQSLTDEIALLNTKLSDGQAQIDVYKQRFADVNGRLRLEEIVGLQIALVEKQKLTADKEAEVNRLQTDFKLFEDAIALRLRETPFQSLEEAGAMLQRLSGQNQASEELAKLENDITQWGAELAKLDGLQVALNEALDVAMPLEEIENQLKNAKEKMTIADFEVKRLEAVIKEQDNRQKDYADISAKIEEQRPLIAAIKAEIADFEAENGMAFRRRVQTNLVDGLLSQTNAILEKISGRYYVRHQNGDRGLRLEIEDTYQANRRRSTKSLSGGESFVVSLALALGLSEVASQGNSLDSLFLDEGFGNLDAETLYTVINTLEGLRAHGKTVGVISHVETVQKRFKAQIQLVKKPNGLGELRKVS